MSIPYPQALRNEWADAYAASCSAIWMCVDARRDVALCLLTAKASQAKAESVLAQRILEKDAALERTCVARERLSVAEDAYFRTVST